MVYAVYYILLLNSIHVTFSCRLIQAMDSNQRWDVGEAIETMKKLAEFKPIWIEEPTSPDDVLGTVPLKNTCTCRSPVKEAL